MKKHDNTTITVDVALNNAVNDSLVSRCISIHDTFNSSNRLTRYALQSLLHEIQVLREFMIINDIKSYTYKDLHFTIADDKFLDIEIIG